MNKENGFSSYYTHEIKKIIKDLKNGNLNREMDESGANGLWDLAGQISIDRQLKEQKEGIDDNEPVYANENEQETLYYAFYEIVENCLNKQF